VASQSDSTYNTDEWYFITGTVNSSGLQTLYVDGIAQTDTEQIQGDSYSNYNFIIGRRSYNALYYFNGSIDNFMVWNTSLSAEEITELYRATRFNTEGNTVDYIGRYTNAIDSGNAASVWTNLSWIETEPTGTTIDLRYRLGNYTPVDTTDTDLVSYWKLNRSDGIVFSSSIENSQVLHMKFVNSTDFYDFSGQGNDGTNVGSAYTDRGYIGGARSFDGVNDYMTLTPFNVTGNGTISVWVKPKVNNVRQAVVGKLHSLGSSATADFSLELNSDGDIYVYAADNVAAQTWDTNIAYTTNVWQHIVVTANSSLLAVYVDGVQRATTAQTRIPAGNSNNYSIGRFGDYSVALYFNGLIDNVRIYNGTSLNTTQIKELYSKEAGTYDEVSDNHGQAQNNVDRTAGIFSDDLALEFDGKDDYVDCGNSTDLLLDDAFSISTWFKWAGPHSTDAFTTIISKSATGFGYHENFMIRVTSAGIVQARIGNGTDETSFSGIDVSDHNWHHAVLVADNGSKTGDFYVDGVSRDPKAIFTPIYTNATAKLTIGIWEGALYGEFNGTIDSVAVYDRSLTANEISDLYINWSGWSTYYTSGPVDIGNFTSRAIQYQALLNTSNDSVTPVFGSFETTDSTPPVITLNYPVNDTILNGRNVDFRCTGTSNANIKNITLYIWNSAGGLVYSDTPTMTPALTVSQNWTYILPSDGTYEYNCKAFNVNDLVFAFASQNKTFNVTFRTGIDNVTTDVNTELKPFDSLENLPQQNNLVGRWDFVEDATDTSIFGNNGTVHGAK